MEYKYRVHQLLTTTATRMFMELDPQYASLPLILTVVERGESEDSGRKHITYTCRVQTASRGKMSLEGVYVRFDEGELSDLSSVEPEKKDA